MDAKFCEFQVLDEIDEFNVLHHGLVTPVGGSGFVVHNMSETLMGRKTFATAHDEVVVLSLERVDVRTYVSRSHFR